MTTYISILRGINVSGHKPIQMAALRKSYENLGFHKITSYVQSGNVVFTAKDTKTNVLEQKISRQIEKDFSYEVPVIVLSLDKLKQIINNNPFLNQPDKEQTFLHVTFLASEPGKYDPKEIEHKKQTGEELFVADNAVYLYCPNGYGKSKLSNDLWEKKLKVRATTRNWKTINKLLGIAQQKT